MQKSHREVVTKNSGCPSESYTCTVVAAGNATTGQIQCECNDPPATVEQFDPADFVDPVIPTDSPQQLVKRIITSLIEAKQAEVTQPSNGPRLRVRPNLNVTTTVATLKPGAANPAGQRTGKRLPLWIEVIDGIFTYKFNVFNNDPKLVDHTKLKAIFAAIKKDADTNLVADYGKTASFNIYQLADMKRPELFQGDRLAIFVGAYGQGAFHYLNSAEPANSYSFPVGGGKLADYNILLPAGNKFDYVPYSIISSDSVPEFYGAPANIYAISPTTVPKDTFYQIIAMASGHEVKEILCNDNTLNWVLFDHFSPTVAGWHWGEFGQDDDAYACTNGILNKKTGYVELPLFLKKFPSGGLLFAVKEVGDVVSAGVCGLLNSYYVDGWLMPNYPLQTFWDPYVSRPGLQYDRLGYVKQPLEPYGGMHQLVFFISFDDAKVRMLEVQNKGPVTQKMRQAPAGNNFPVDYVYARVVQEIKPELDIVSFIASFENYGPSKRDQS